MQDLTLAPYFKSIIDTDNASVVICNLEHTIIYMNPAAMKNYAKRGGAGLIGSSLLDCHNVDSQHAIVQVTDWFQESKEHNRVHTFYNEKQNKDVYMIALRNEEGTLIGYYEKHEFRTRDEAPFYQMD